MREQGSLVLVGVLLISWASAAKGGMLSVSVALLFTISRLRQRPLKLQDAIGLTWLSCLLVTLPALPAHGVHRVILNRKVQDNEIHLKLRIEAEGRWIGFGLGEPTSGSMPGSLSLEL